MKVTLGVSHLKNLVKKWENINGRAQAALGAQCRGTAGPAWWLFGKRECGQKWPNHGMVEW